MLNFTTVGPAFLNPDAIGSLPDVMFADFRRTVLEGRGPIAQ